MFPELEPENWESVGASEYASRFLVEAEPVFYTGFGVGYALFVTAADNEIPPAEDFSEYLIPTGDAAYLDRLREIFSPVSPYLFDVDTVVEVDWLFVDPRTARGNYATAEEARAAAERLIAQGVPVEITRKPNGYWAIVVSHS